MSNNNENNTEQYDEQDDNSSCAPQYYYVVRFRNKGQEHSVGSDISDLKVSDIVMVRTDHGPEPAYIEVRLPGVCDKETKPETTLSIIRRANREEIEKFERLPELEQEAFAICNEKISELNLCMQLIRVERFFNGSKIIFYFAAENRVDFRELVKKLVQEFRTRVEMRQIGVRHETQMIGGIGPCGRELCCSTFLNTFESVSIKMAKTQDLPLNPAKISGLCNRLLCCLTYEYDAYCDMKKGMPKFGRWINYEGDDYRVIRLMPLQGNILAVNKEGEEIILTEEQWRLAESLEKGPEKQD